MAFAIIYTIVATLKSSTGDAGGAVKLAFKFLPNAILLIGILRYTVIGQGKLHFRPILFSSKSYLYLGLLLLIIISLVRTAYPMATPIGILNDSAPYILLNLLVYIVITKPFHRQENFDFLFTKGTLKVLLVPSVIVAIMLLFYIVGYNDPSVALRRQGEDAVILKLLGINLPKKVVPYVGVHPNAISIFAGATLIMTIIALLVMELNRQEKQWLYLNVLICGAFMLIADSRGTIFNFLMTLMMVYFTYKFRFSGVLRVFVIIVPFLPFLFMLMLSAFSNMPFMAQFSRSGDTENLSTMSARSYIWEYCQEEVEQFKTMHFFGWGEHGQSPAGVSAKYRDIFNEDDYDNDLIVTHNMFYQAFFDVGYIGIIFLLATLYFAMNHAILLHSRGYRAGLVYIGFFTYFILSGTLESTFGNHYKIYNIVLMVITTAIFAFYNEYLKLSRQ